MLVYVGERTRSEVWVVGYEMRGTLALTLNLTLTCWPHSSMYLAVEVAALATLMAPAGPISVIGGQLLGSGVFSKVTSRSSMRRVPDLPHSRSPIPRDVSGYDS